MLLGEVVKDLISGAAIALRNAQQTFHVFDVEIGNAPPSNFFR